MAKQSAHQKSGQSAAHMRELARHSAALRAHTKALIQHTKKLTAATAKMDAMKASLDKHFKAHAITPPTTASQLVYSCLADYGLKSPVPSTTKLSDLGFDTPALAGLAADIRGHGVSVDTGAIQACTTIADVIKVVAAAAK